MRVRFTDKTKQTATLKSYYIYKKKILRIIDFIPQAYIVYLKKTRFFRFQILPNTNMSSLLKSP